MIGNVRVGLSSFRGIMSLAAPRFSPSFSPAECRSLAYHQRSNGFDAISWLFVRRALFKLYFNCRLADARPVRVQSVANGVMGSRRKTPEPSRPTTRIPAESHPRSPCKSSQRCKGDALRAKLAGTASPTHSPPACPPTSRNSSPALPNLVHWQRHRLARAQTLRGIRDPPRCLAGHSPTSNPPYKAASLAAERVSPELPVYLRRSSSSSRHPRCN